MIIKMQKCDRCTADSEWLTMSKFNTDMICDKCWDAEHLHPKYDEASMVELEAVRAGVRNFPGIGLPEDLVGGGHHLLPKD